VESTHTAGEQELGAPTGFRLILDTGTFHGLTDEQRTAMGREVDAVAAADADRAAARLAAPAPTTHPRSGA
jgi:hypothetical protein